MLSSSAQYVQRGDLCSNVSKFLKEAERSADDSDYFGAKVLAWILISFISRIDNEHDSVMALVQMSDMLPKMLLIIFSCLGITKDGRGKN